ncbi:MAG TPA: isoprenylcysteine carboxylmethyltransferase family protein [Gemmatimonadales bacterium]|nr:isoprenylcysteine carboxylmethyltransferase family protein [Gemmatimonadales bacterium]
MIKDPWRFRPPHYLLLALLSMVGLRYLFPYPLPVPSPFHLLAVPLLIAGLVLIVAPAWEFHRRETALDPFGEASVLVTDGWFRYSRNPIYTGMVLVLLAAALGLHAWAPLIVVPIFVAIIRTRFIRMEERFLSQKFGETYRQYCSQVRRWI